MPETPKVLSNEQIDAIPFEALAEGPAASFIKLARKIENLVVAELGKDTERLEWLQFHGAQVAWGSDDEYCNVRWSDRDGQYQTELYADWREAIDSAMAGRYKEIG